ncbi:class I SAM-dependent methyltransferase [bacterium]|nr:class I SAM-dependent methyltransferase [bacterium]
MRPALRLLAEQRGEVPALLLAGAHHPLLHSKAVVQPHRGDRLTLAAPDWDGQERFSEIHLLATPSREETLAYLGLARRALAPGGQLYMSVENALGADGWRKRLQPLSALSKHKCRLLQLSAEHLPNQGDPLELRPPNAQADFVSCPGLFSWDRLDPGSQFLTQHLPKSLPGCGADLGCGPGLLGRQLLTRGCQRLDLIDVDQRAVQASLQNCGGDPRVRALWLDLVSERPPGGYAWVTLNPPFHGSGRENRALGVAMLGRAVESLKPSGQLWLVANQHLPYPQVLASMPVTVIEVHVGRGYKVMRCQKNA